MSQLQLLIHWNRGYGTCLVKQVKEKQSLLFSEENSNTVVIKHDGRTTDYVFRWCYPSALLGQATNQSLHTETTVGTLLTNREELSFLVVLAFPIASKGGLACMTWSSRLPYYPMIWRERSRGTKMVKHHKISWYIIWSKDGYLQIEMSCRYGWSWHYPWLQEEDWPGWLDLPGFSDSSIKGIQLD